MRGSLKTKTTKLIEGIRENKSFVLLFFGRFYYRIAFLILTLVLSTIWEKGVFGHYATKMGTWLIIDTIISSGMGASIPKLLVRYKSLQEVLIRQAMLVAVFISFVIICITSAVGLLLSRTFNVGFDMLDIMVICSLLAFSTSSVLQSIYRVLGRVSRDYTISFLLGSFILLLALISFFVEMSPMTNVAVRVLLFVVVDICVAYQILTLYPLKKKYGFKVHIAAARKIMKETTAMAFNYFTVDGGLSFINIVFRLGGLYYAAADFGLVLAVAGPFMTFYRYLLFVLIPKIMHFAHKQKEVFIKKYSKILLGFVALTIFFSIASGIMLMASGIEMTLNFANNNYDLKLLILFFFRILLVLICESLLVYFEVGMKNLIFTSRVCLVGFIVCSTATLLFIPLFYAYGAVFSLMLADISLIIIFGFFFVRQRARA